MTKVSRLSYLRPGEAVVGQQVQLERSGNRLIAGTIKAIEDARRAGRPRICSVQVGRQPLPIREYEDRLQIEVKEEGA